MSFLGYILGKGNQNEQSGVKARIVSGAHGALNQKIIKNPLNKWWMVLLRQYLLWPVLRLPFRPLAEANKYRPLYKNLSYVLDVLAANGIKLPRGFISGLKEISSKKNNVEKFLTLLLALVWKRRTKDLVRSGGFRDQSGRILWWEKHLTVKLFAYTYVSWTISIMCMTFVPYVLILEGFRPVSADVNLFSRSGDFMGLLLLGQSSVIPLLAISALFWIISLSFSFIISERQWVSFTIQVEKFLTDFGFFSEFSASKARVFAFADFIYLSYPNLSLPKVRQLKSGWPRHFLPGEYMENQRNPDDLIVFRRPEKEAIIFGGENARSDIYAHLKAFEAGIIHPMKAAIKKKSDEELLFVGEVIDNKWWADSKIFLGLGTSPHCYIVGQTRSGKTKTVLSIIYSFARAYPDTVWLIADGKASNDYDLIASRLSFFPVAKPDSDHGDNLIQLANQIEWLWSEYMQRRYLFEKAASEGFPCSTIYQYRELVGPMPQIWFVIDEFSFFVGEMDFENNWRTENTLAWKLKHLANQAASVGFHLMFASHRYTKDDVPTNLRSALTTKIVHNVQIKDAEHLEVMEATTLGKGQFYVTAHGLFCHHTGISKVKAKMPFIGEKPDELIQKTLPVYDPMLKKIFDYHLIYNRGGDELEKMSISQFCVRLHKYFKDQGYSTKNRLADLEAEDVQLEIQKSKRVKVTPKDKAAYIELEPIPSAVKVGVAVIKFDEIDESSIIDMQDKYSGYQAIIVFVVGKNISTDKLKFVQKINERGTRFVILPSKIYTKDMRFVEMKRKEGEYVDIIKDRLARVGISVSGNQASAPITENESFSKEVPVITLIERFLDVVKLKPSTNFADFPGVNLPIVKTTLPGGTPLFFVIASVKADKTELSQVLEIAAKRKSAVIVVSQVFSESDKKLTDAQVIFWSSGALFAMIQRMSKNKEEVKDIITMLMDDLGLLKVNVEKGDSGFKYSIAIHPDARLRVASHLTTDGAIVKDCEIKCDLTGYSLLTISNLDIQHYRLDYLKIPVQSTIIIDESVAPLGTKSDRLIDERKKKTAPKLPSGWEVEGGIVVRAKTKIEEDDLLSGMRDFT